MSPPANAGNRSISRSRKILHAVEQRSQCHKYWAHAPEPLTATPEPACCPLQPRRLWTCAPAREEPPQREARALQPRAAPTRGSQRKPPCSKEDPARQRSKMKCQREDWSTSIYFIGDITQLSYEKTIKDYVAKYIEKSIIEDYRVYLDKKVTFSL